jgi:hypothetical protein
MIPCYNGWVISRAWMKNAYRKSIVESNIIGKGPEESHGMDAV